MGEYNLQVTIDQDSGFCFGVVYAIDMAEEILDEDGYLYCLGDIVHNDEEVSRLKAKGLRIISHEDLAGLKGEKVLIRPLTVAELANWSEYDLERLGRLTHPMRYEAELDPAPFDATTAYSSPSFTRINGLLRRAPVFRPRVVRMMTGTPLRSPPSRPPVRSYCSTWSAALLAGLGMYVSSLTVVLPPLGSLPSLYP